MDLSSIDDLDRDAKPEPPPPCAEEAPWLALELELEDLPPPREVEECDAGFDDWDRDAKPGPPPPCAEEAP